MRLRSFRPKTSFVTSVRSLPMSIQRVGVFWRSTERLIKPALAGAGVILRIAAVPHCAVRLGSEPRYHTHYDVFRQGVGGGGQSQARRSFVTSEDARIGDGAAGPLTSHP